MESMASEIRAPEGRSGPLVRALVAMAMALRAWERRYWSRRALEEMNDAGLRDIGVSRGEALHEARKPLWRS